MKKYDNQWIKDAMNGVPIIQDDIIRIKKEKMMYDKLVDMKKIKNGIEIAKIHLEKTVNILEDLLNKLKEGLK